MKEKGKRQKAKGKRQKGSVRFAIFDAHRTLGHGTFAFKRRRSHPNHFCLLPFAFCLLPFSSSPGGD